MNTTQLIHTPDSISGGTQYQQLGYLDAYDAVNNGFIREVGALIRFL